MKIGLTGSIACGKSTVSNYLRSLGHTVVDADEISRALTAPGGAALPAIRETFGDGVFDGDVLDRRALGSLVFSGSERRAMLNALLHPMIISSVVSALEASDAPGQIVFGDIPLLFECGMEKSFDRIWVVSAPRELQIARLKERDGLDCKEAERRIDAQMPLTEKELRADAIILTNGPIEHTQNQVRHLLNQLISISC